MQALPFLYETKIDKGFPRGFNHCKAWSTARAQVLTHLRDLLTCQRFELIGTFLHVVTKQEEEEVKEETLAID